MAGMNSLAPEGWRKPWPFGVFPFGLFFVVLAVVAIFSGTLYGRGGKVVRQQNPVGFWLVLILQLAVGAFLMCHGVTMQST
jgi:hypothetical protein